MLSGENVGCPRDRCLTHGAADSRAVFVEKDTFDFRQSTVLVVWENHTRFLIPTSDSVPKDWRDFLGQIVFLIYKPWKRWGLRANHSPCAHVGPPSHHVRHALNTSKGLGGPRKSAAKRAAWRRGARVSARHLPAAWRRGKQPIHAFQRRGGARAAKTRAPMAWRRGLSARPGA